MYSFDARVRYSETDGEEYLTLQSIIDYFQDAAIFHTMELGQNVSVLKGMDCAWMTCSWQIEILRYPEHGEKINVSTWAYGFKSFMGERNCLMSSQDGEPLVKAASIWSYMDLKLQRPKKVSDEIIEMYGVEKPLDMEYKPRKIAYPKEGGEILPCVTVEKHHLDSLGHVNNGQYVKIALDYKTFDERVTSFRAEYKSQAHLGDKIFPIRFEEDDREIIVLTAEDGNVYSVFEIMKPVAEEGNE